ncbi:amidohydrolase family protein [Sphingobium lignivorans]|uniref:Cytosine/adenosine deaminase-related metal-dependent hydrolase n=1 Tax=Sphingobium lignivorans TaxID=2735886 RepID=A0ABR6NDL6_9SPHN|nr:amidohydrolase family protein [Sphingobium lignivorans]MBB5985368.1 cytosine/adenosine deaminase-related metal-dependent hydrolase [Sphingobium lignivorans]
MDVTRKGFLGLAAGSLAAGAMAGRSVTATAATAKSADAVRPAHRTLIKGADIITMDPAHGEILGGDVLLDGGKIVAVGKGLTADGAEIIDARGMILMPGMIDSHRHVWEGMDNGVVAKISKTVNYYNEYKLRTMVSYTPEDAWLAQYASAIQAIDSGVTSLIDYCHIFHTAELAEQAARGLIDSGIAGTFCYQVSHSPTYKPGDTVKWDDANAMRNAPADEQHWQTVRLLQERVFTGKDGLVRFGLCASPGFSDRPMTEIRDELAKMRTFEPHIIAQHHRRSHVQRPPEVFNQFSQLGEWGLLGPDYHVSHGTGFIDEELDMCRDTGTMICATTMGEHSYPDPSVHGRARQRGVAVGIGVDGALAFTHDYFQHVRGAFYNLFRTDIGKEIASAYQGEDVLDFVTRLGARSIREDGVTGTISAGKRADMLLLKTDRINFPITGLLADRVVNYSNQPDIDTVWIAGVVRKRAGRMVGVDMAALKAKINEASTRINRDGATIRFV